MTFYSETGIVCLLGSSFREIIWFLSRKFSGQTKTLLWDKDCNSHTGSEPLFKKLTVFQVDMKCHVFYGRRNVIDRVNRILPLHPILSHLVPATPSHPTSLWRILKLCSHLCLGPPNGFFHSVFETKILYAFLVSAMPHPSHPPCFCHSNNIRWSVKVTKLFIKSFDNPPVISSLSSPYILFSILFPLPLFSS